MGYPAAGGSVWIKALRLCPLDALGNPQVGQSAFITDIAMKLTATPVKETGDDIFVRGGDGLGKVIAKKGDIVKRYTLDLSLAEPDNNLEALLAGGTVFASSASALGAPTGLTATPQTTLGTLTAGAYVYGITQTNANGESVLSTLVNATTTGSTGAVVLSGYTPAAAAEVVTLYGRTAGGIRSLASQVVLGATITTTSTSGTGSVTSLAVSGGISVPIPAGFTFQISGDTNAVKIVFTTTSAVTKGATSIPVSVSQTVTTTIAAAAIIPVLVDTSVWVPTRVAPLVDQTAGIGTGDGYQTPLPGIIGNPTGVSIEAWSSRVLATGEATDYPDWWHVFPKVKNFVVGARNITNANMESDFSGEAYTNANWGTGPDGTWDKDSTGIYQRRICTDILRPLPSVTPTTVLL